MKVINTRILGANNVDCMCSSQPTGALVIINYIKVSSFTKLCVLMIYIICQNGYLEDDIPTWMKLEYPFKWQVLITWIGLNVHKIRLSLFFFLFVILKFCATTSSCHNCCLLQASRPSSILFLNVIYLMMLSVILRLYGVKWLDDNEMLNLPNTNPKHYTTANLWDSWSIKCILRQ